MLTNRIRQRRVGVIAPPPIPPFSGTFLDTAAGDSMAARLNVPANAALTVGASSATFNSSTALNLDAELKDAAGNVIWTALDWWKLEASVTVTGPLVTGGPTCHYLGGKSTVADAYLFGGHVESFSTTHLWPKLTANSIGAVVNGSLIPFVSPHAVTLSAERRGNLLRATIAIGAVSQTLDRVLHYTADSFELPRMFLKPFFRFGSGNLVLNSIKFSASYPNPNYGFLGDSLTQGRFASAYADAFPQLIRGDHPGQVIVAGAPAATCADWLNATGPFLAMRPKKVFILMGTNDIGNGLPLATIQADYTTLVNRVIAAGAVPVVLTVPPRGSANVPTFNTWLKAQGWAYIDIYPALLGTGNSLAAAYNSGDGVHLTTAGNLVVADLVRGWIAS